MDSKDAAIKMAALVLDLIRTAGDEGIPSGHLYAMLNGHGMSLNTYNLIIDLLKQVGKITESFHLLKAV